MNTYRTAEIARMIGIHPNTVRLYETLGLVSKPERRANGYRVFTELHLAQFRLARTALQVEVLQNGLRKNAIEIIVREDHQTEFCRGAADPQTSPPVAYISIDKATGEISWPDVSEGFKEE